MQQQAKQGRPVTGWMCYRARKEGRSFTIVSPCELAAGQYTFLTLYNVLLHRTDIIVIHKRTVKFD